MSETYACKIIIVQIKTYDHISGAEIIVGKQYDGKHFVGRASRRKLNYC